MRADDARGAQVLAADGVLEPRLETLVHLTNSARLTRELLLQSCSPPPPPAHLPMQPLAEPRQRRVESVPPRVGVGPLHDLEAAQDGARTAARLAAPGPGVRQRAGGRRRRLSGPHSPLGVNWA